MKRTHGTMDSPSLPQQTTVRRQEPVSCNFCRLKKLKCSREVPCSNCAARNLECVSAKTGAITSATPGPQVPRHAGTKLSLQSLHARLQRIEHVLSLPTGHFENMNSAQNIPLETSRLLSSSSTIPLFCEPIERATDNDTRLTMESVELTNHLARSGSRLQSSFDASQLLQVWPINPESQLGSSQWYEMLPTYERAVELLEFYTHNVCWTYHFVHMPTLRRHLQHTYNQLSRNISPDASVLALICAMFALSKYFTQHSANPLDSECHKVGEEGYEKFVSLALHALAEARHLDHPTVETIQAVLLLASHLLLNTGATTAFRLLLTAMCMSAQALLIHQVDSPKNQRLRENCDYNCVELEIKRRLWWHIASSDWIFAFMSGTQTATYVVHSNRIHVNLPSNTDDAAITPTHCPDEPLNVPTEMTYFLFRCRLSIIFREFLDAAAEQGLDVDEVEYDTVLAFDRKINAFIESVPYFLQITPESKQKCVHLDQQRPYLVYQRLMAQFGASTRMSGLHRAYMARGIRDPKYAYSRMVCLRSARTVLELEKVIRAEMLQSLRMPDPSKIWAMMYQVFFATMILVMDFHFTKDEPQADERMEEIRECFRKLEAAKEVSSVAERGLEELKRVMRKWGLLPSEHSKASRSEEQCDHEVVERGAALLSESLPVHSDHETPSMTREELIEPSWVESWDFDVELDVPQWNALFQDLESQSGMF